MITLDVGLDRRGDIYWHGDRISMAQFADYLAVAQTLHPQPEVFLEVEMGVPCNSLEAVRDEMDRRLQCRDHGPCAEGVRSIWAKTPDPPGTPPS